uniref:Uncharacterized protein n=1 Tax=Onchocerca volvulus TaxID=6282 RepID=A0A8R1XS85_ONCVO
MYAKSHLKSWSEQQRSNESGTRVQRHEHTSTDTSYVNIGEQIKLDADEAVKDLELRIAKTRERAAGHGISDGHRHRHHRHNHHNHRNSENGTFIFVYCL